MARFGTKSNSSSPALVKEFPLHGSNNKDMTPKDDNEETRRIRQTLQRWQTYASVSAVDALESTAETPDASLSPRRVRKVVGGGTVPVSPMSVRKPPSSYRPMLPPPPPSPRYCPAPDSPHSPTHGGFVRNQRRLSISSTRICANLASPISNTTTTTTTNRRSVMATMRGQSARGLSCRHLLVTD
jgi:hypothetical protein